MNKKRYIPLIIFLVLVMAFLIQLGRNMQGDDPRALESVLIGKKAPEKILTSLEGQKYDTQTLFHQGKPVLVNVWASWCPTCYEEHQYLNKLAKQGVNIIGIDYKDDPIKALKWLHELGNPYQVVLKDEKGSFGLDLGVYGAPETFILDGKGIIRYRHTGDVNNKVWQKVLKPIYDKYNQEGNN